MLLGIIAGLSAGALWGFAFLVPKILTDYSAADIALGRYVVFGAASAVILLSRWRHIRADISWRLFLQAAGLGSLAFSFYYFALSASIQYSGTVLASLIIGLLPVSIPLISHDKIIRRNLFVLSLVMIVSGLLLLNLPALLDSSTRQIPAAHWGLGLALALAALIMWTFYAPLNTKIMQQHPAIDSTTWTSLLGIFAFMTMLPIWLVSNQGHIPLLGDFLNGRFVFWMLVIGLGSSWLGIYLWNFACRRIPTALAGQLIVSETIFALIYSYIYDWQIPTVYELSAALLLISGAVAGIRSFATKSS